MEANSEIKTTELESDEFDNFVEDHEMNLKFKNNILQNLTWVMNIYTKKFFIKFLLYTQNLQDV